MRHAVLLICLLSLGATASREDFVPQATTLRYTDNGQVFGYGFGASTNVARGNGLIAALNAASDGDELVIGPGTYDIQNTELDLGLGGSATINLRGSDADSSVIESDQLLIGDTAVGPGFWENECMVIPGDNSHISNITIHGTAIGATEFQAPVGILNTFHSAATGWRFTNCKFVSGTDNIYLNHAIVCSGTIENCEFVSKWDTIFMDGHASSELIVRNCKLAPVGPFNSENTDCVNFGEGIIRMYACSLSPSGAGGFNSGVTVLSGASLYLYGCNITTPSPMNDKDILNAGGVVYVDAATVYDADKVIGSITKLSAFGSASELRNAAGATSGVFPVTSGGTGGSSASTARTSLGLAIGSDVQAFDTDLSDLADGQLSGSKVESATTTNSGVIELATAAETTAGTDTGRSLTPDGLAGSDYGKRSMQVLLSDPNGDPISIGDGIAGFQYRIPAEMNGWNLVGVAASVTTASSAGTPTFQIHNITQAADMLSTALTIDVSEMDSATAATPAVIDAVNDDVATANKLRVDVDTAGTGTKGLSISLTFQAP